MSQNLQNVVKFQKFQLENLVDFEKCCKTHIFLQNSEPIQPKTSNILTKFCQLTLSDVAVAAPSTRVRRGSSRPSEVGVALGRVLRKVGDGHVMDRGGEGSFSAVSKPNFARKYAFESSRRDLHNALLCTALKTHFFL